MVFDGVFSIRGHDYTIDEIQALPDRALSMGGSSKTRAKIDADRNVAFLTDNAGELVFDRQGMPVYTVIRKRGQTSVNKAGASDDMLKAIGNARKQAQKNTANGTQVQAKESPVNLTLMLIGVAVVVIPASLLLILFLH